MIEKTILDYLSSVLTVSVYAEVPVNPSGRFIVIEKTGGGGANRLHEASIAIRSYADTLYEAAELNESVKAAMDEAITLPSISHCALNADYNFTDPSTKQYRYQAIYNITHY